LFAQPAGVEAEGTFGPLEPFSPQADFMTQPVSTGSRWQRADVSCSEPAGADSEAFTCDETHTVSCSAERAHRVATAVPSRDALGGEAQRGDVPRGLDYCRRAHTVVEGFLCDEPVVVSDACRKPGSAFDEFVCDDPKMQRLEWAILRETWALVKAMALSVFRGRP
jgi:hypothetical protein